MTGLLRRAYDAGRQLARAALLPLMRPRRINVSCCGLSKTGTHSLAGLFEDYRSSHHPDAEVRLPLAKAFMLGQVDAAHVERILRRRDRQLWLEMESSSLAGILIEPFVKVCTDRKFILTMRDVYSWCDSWIDHNINSPPGTASAWAALDRVRLKVDQYPPTKYGAPLVERGCQALATYFQLWTAHNGRVLRTVPPDRLMLVRTHEINERIPDIAAWVGIPQDNLRRDRSWLFQASRKHRVLATLDPSYVRATADEHCSGLMQQYFPEVSSPN